MASGDTVLTIVDYDVYSLLTGLVTEPGKEGYTVEFVPNVNGTYPNQFVSNRVVLQVMKNHESDSTPSNPFVKTKNYDIVIKEH